VYEILQKKLSGHLLFLNIELYENEG